VASDILAAGIVFAASGICNEQHFSSDRHFCNERFSTWQQIVTALIVATTMARAKAKGCSHDGDSNSDCRSDKACDCNRNIEARRQQK
jgi:hypothetical protein